MGINAQKMKQLEYDLFIRYLLLTIIERINKEMDDNGKSKKDVQFIKKKTFWKRRKYQKNLKWCIKKY